MGCLVSSADSGAQNKPSLVGTWKLDVAQSDFGSEPGPRSVTVTTLKDTPQMLSYRVHGIDDKGKPFAYSWSGPQDGSTHPTIANGKPVGQQSVQREPEGTLIRHGEDSTATFNGRGSFSPDGNTLIDEETDKSKDGKVTKQKAVWHRVTASNAKPASSQ
jgi:hypothetical protein